MLSQALKLQHAGTVVLFACKLDTLKSDYKSPSLQSRGYSPEASGKSLLVSSSGSRIPSVTARHLQAVQEARYTPSSQVAHVSLALQSGGYSPDTVLRPLAGGLGRVFQFHLWTSNALRHCIGGGGQLHTKQPVRRRQPAQPAFRADWDHRDP